ncbi:MAG: transglycosylase SLT domain-containing protein, partial [Nanoarchaeota archaeon]|nr:transglycosylase SLT domain-containing protein [Nanoarchaeota archaeon]
KLFVGMAISLSLSLIPYGSLATKKQTELYEQVVDYENTGEKSELIKIIEKEPKIEEYLPLIEKAVEKHKDIYPLDPLAVIALLKAETSSFNKDAISFAGAAGLAQIISETAEAYELKAYNPKYISQAREDRRESYRYKNKMVIAAQNLSKTETYLIKKGDTLSKIAKNKGLTIKEILKLNPKIKNPGKIMAGDTLTIKVGNEKTIDEIIGYSQKYQEYREKANEAFKKYKEELKEMIEGKTEEELKQIDGRFVPEIAIDFCVKHFAELMKARDGDLREAASAYNAGLGAVKKYKGIPAYDETVKYQNKIVNYYRNYKKFMQKD